MLIQGSSTTMSDSLQNSTRVNEEKLTTDDTSPNSSYSKTGFPSTTVFYTVAIVVCIIVTMVTAPFARLKSVLQKSNVRPTIPQLHTSLSTSSNALVERPEVALCIAGNARTFYVPFVHNKIIENIIQPLRSRYPTDVFVLMKISDNPRPGFPEVPVHKYATLQSIAKLSPTVVTLLNSTHDYETTRMADGDNRTVIVPQYCKNVNPNATAMLPYTLVRSAQCLSAIEAREQERGKRYRWIYRARPDVALLDPIISPDDISTGSIHTSAGPWPSIKDLIDWWQEKHEPFRNIPSFGDHFLAGRRREAGVAMRAIEAIDSCEIFDVKGPRNSESSLGLWLLSNGLRIKSQLWSWSVVRTISGPDCDRMELVQVPDPVLRKIMIDKCKTFRASFMREYRNWSKT